MVPRIPSWTKGVAVAVLPVPPRPFVDKRCCSRSSPSLRVPSWTKGVAVAVLRVSVALRGQKVLQSPSSLRGQKVLQLQFSVSSVALRGQKVLQLQFSVVPPWPFVDKRCCSSAVLRVPPWPFVDKRCCSCSSPCPSVALRGQKVLQFCSSPCPSVALRGQKVLQLQFSVSLRGSSWTKGVAVAVLRVPPWLFVDKRCCSCSSPWSSVALRGQKVLQFCSSPCPSVALRGQKVLQLQFSVVLRGPSWTKGVAVLQFSVSLRGPSWTKSVAVAVLRVPPWPFVDKRCCSCSSPCPSVDQKTVLPALSCILVDE